MAAGFYPSNTPRLHCAQCKGPHANFDGLNRPRRHASYNLLESLPVLSPTPADQLPVGLGNSGHPVDETTVLKPAHAYERHTPWHTLLMPNA